MTHVVSLPPNLNLALTSCALVGIHTTQEVTALASGLPVDGVGAYQRTMARLVVPVVAGDVLDIEGRQRVTNNIGPNEYTAGIGYWFDGYDLDDGVPSGDPAKVWTRIGSLNGENVDRDLLHHLPIHLHDVYQVPTSWPEGHRMVVSFRACAASTAWMRNGGTDKISVDDYGVLTVRHYRPTVDDPRWADVTTLQQQVDTLAAQVAVLIPPQN